MTRRIPVPSLLSILTQGLWLSLIDLPIDLRTIVYGTATSPISGRH